MFPKKQNVVRNKRPNCNNLQNAQKKIHQFTKKTRFYINSKRLQGSLQLSNGIYNIVL